MSECPSSAELLTYVEGLAGDGAPIFASIASHVGECLTCAREVDELQSNFEAIGQLNAIEPSGEFAAKVLLASQYERRLIERTERRRRVVVTTGKVAAVASIAAAVAFAAASGPEPAPVEQASISLPVNPSFAQTFAAPAPVVDGFRETARDVQTLSLALHSSLRAPQTVRERMQLKAVETLNDDMAVAFAALEQNPRCVRAGRMVYSSVNRQAQTLRALYEERTR